VQPGCTTTAGAEWTRVAAGFRSGIGGSRPESTANPTGITLGGSPASHPSLRNGIGTGQDSKAAPQIGAAWKPNP
jgi:hypothetical protein